MTASITANTGVAVPEIDMKLVVAVLADELGLKRLVLEGGPTVNGSFVSAGLVGEISLLILPLVDGRGEHPDHSRSERKPGRRPLIFR